MIYRLSNEKIDALIESRGAQLISLRDKAGCEFIWQREPNHWEECAPVLFPVVGNCRDRKITVDGKDYPMPQVHGFALSSEFEAVSCSDTKVVFRLKDSGETKKHYPFSFVLTVTHTLKQNTIVTEFQVENPSESIMFFGIGGHPGFRCPLEADETFEDYELDFGEPVTLENTCVSEEGVISATEKKIVLQNERVLPLKRELFEPDALIFENPTFRDLSLLSGKSGRGIHFSFENFTSLGIWTERLPAKADFLCLEPWNGMGKRSGEGTELAKKKDIIALQAGKVFNCRYGITCLNSES